MEVCTLFCNLSLLIRVGEVAAVPIRARGALDVVYTVAESLPGLLFAATVCHIYAEDTFGGRVVRLLLVDHCPIRYQYRSL